MSTGKEAIVNVVNQYTLDNDLDIPNGRRKIKLILHEIFNSSDEYQENGVSWREEYVLANIESVKNMILAVEIRDYDALGIGGHGNVELVDGEYGLTPVFDSIAIGTFTNAYITDVEIDGIVKRVLIGEALLYDDRNHDLVEGFKEQLEYGNLYCSVEIVGKKKNGNALIFYGDNDGVGRVPMEYDYSGCAILSTTVKAGDSSAYIMEINSDTKNKEEVKLGEKLTVIELNQIADAVKATIKETNESTETLHKRIDELVESGHQKDNEIDKLKREVTDLKKDADERQRVIDDINKKKELEVEELNALRKETRTNKFMSEYNALPDDIRSECNEIKDEFEKNASNDNVDVNAYVKELHAMAYNKIKEKKVDKEDKVQVNSAVIYNQNSATVTETKDLSKLDNLFN